LADRYCEANDDGRSKNEPQDASVHALSFVLNVHVAHAVLAAIVSARRALGRIDDPRLATINVAMPYRRVLQTSRQRSDFEQAARESSDAGGNHRSTACYATLAGGFTNGRYFVNFARS
jgi:hypothetical protein